MDAIFGKGAPPELVHPKNGILLSCVIKDQFDRGLFAIVPALADNPTAEEIANSAEDSGSAEDVKDEDDPMLLAAGWGKWI
ncbi:hypothetical protein PRK78_006394 [Emydomyces testavorans]|uniref:HNH nuclease domain-containing protein n=1 Tax=Emydomyces testavorans TaxID=2070801 RepID=A0AAF0DP31_9EURO|nr:hypothetical protein PRK78_006394 [Emydomyces testavorans]